MNPNTFCKAVCGISAAALLLFPAIAFADEPDSSQAQPTLAVKNTMGFTVEVLVPTAKGPLAAQSVDANGDVVFKDIPVGKVFAVEFRPFSGQYMTTTQSVGPLGWGATMQLEVKLDRKGDLGDLSAEQAPSLPTNTTTPSVSTTTPSTTPSTTSTTTTTWTSIPAAAPAVSPTTSTTTTTTTSIPTPSTTTTSIPPVEPDEHGNASWLWIVATLSVFIAGVAVWPLLRRAVGAWRRFEENGIVRHSFGTRIGTKDANEDAGWVGDVRLADGRAAFLACVADGVSGGVDGDKVAAMSVAALRAALGKAGGECFASEESVRDWCRGWAAQLQRDVFAKHSDGYSTLCAFIEVAGSWFVLSVGDSRVFWIPDSGEGSVCLTEKHLQSIAMLKNGVPEERAVDYAHSLVRAVGLPVGAGEDFLDVGRVEPFRRGWIVVGTDGVFDVLTSSDLWKMARTTHLAFRFVRRILHAAVGNVTADGASAGAYRDNATVAVRRID